MQALYDVTPRRLRFHGEERRDRIMSLVQSYMGMRFSELANRTGFAHGKLTHHMNILERQKRVIVKRSGGSTWFFPEGCDNDLCGAFISSRHTTTLAILALLMKQECNFNQIKKKIMRSGSTVCEHLNRLHSAGLVSKRRVDRKWVYGVADTDKAVMVMLRRGGNWNGVK